MCVCVHTSVCVYVHTCVCVFVCVLVTHSYLTLCDPMDCSPSGSSAHGILKARIPGVSTWIVEVSTWILGYSKPRILGDSLL